ncbi:hypothetical protein Ae201684P_012788 [Aphanomyces euteiches]|uniref:Uncharacterized protein n=1 Tax=Aphanomyces euteiches TaxID=100861 RepID=A0A6G0WAC5_9STRA|nr:hypothetical protein Ae201684_017600 [Aphanomyces euteiches]KAH9076302.1 hypothetical protein Ae201684P_012788 [Aphanomyces euteiches]
MYGRRLQVHWQLCNSFSNSPPPSNMKFVHLVVLLVCLLSVVVAEASRWDRFKGWVSKKGTKARNFKNKLEVTAALDGLKKFET